METLQFKVTPNIWARASHSSTVTERFERCHAEQLLSWAQGIVVMCCNVMRGEFACLFWN